MDKKFLSSLTTKVFFIGAGGVSMSGLAKLLAHRGYSVSGSDKQKSGLTRELEGLGVKIYYSHDSQNIKDAGLVVYSSAISGDNVELEFAKRQGILTVKRSELLGEILSSYKRSVAISGCHGKTTSTAMLGDIMRYACQRPTIFLGGEHIDYGNFLNGKGDLAIAEACEYKKSFLDIKPKISVVLNIDNDHLDSYGGMKELIKSFREFVGDNLAVINADEKYINDISNSTTVTFGINNVATYYASDIKETVNGVSFTACAYAKPYGRINLSVKGKHNVYNALSAFACADMLGAPFSAVKRGLENFKGVKRRNEFLGQAKGVKYYADYAHHPSEIKATLSAFNACEKEFITVFQPHTYSRTRILMQDFIDAFKGYDNVIIYKSYPAREKFDIKGSAKRLQKNLEKRKIDCAYARNEKELKNEIDKRLKQDKSIIFLGAGDIYDIAQKLVKRRQIKVQKINGKS